MHALGTYPSMFLLTFIREKTRFCEPSRIGTLEPSPNQLLNYIFIRLKLFTALTAYHFCFSSRMEKGKIYDTSGSGGAFSIK